MFLHAPQMSNAIHSQTNGPTDKTIAHCTQCCELQILSIPDFSSGTCIVKYHKKNAKRVRMLEAKKAGYHLRRVCPANTFFTYIYTFPHSSSLSEADNATARLNKWRIERVCFCNHRLALQTDRHSDLQAAQRRADGRTTGAVAVRC